MTWAPISLITIQYQNPNDNTPYSGAVLKAYAAGTSTNIPMATDVTGATTFTSVALNSSGNPEHLGATIIPHIDQVYKIALYANQAAADADTPSVWSIDNLTPVTVTGSFTLIDAISGGVSNVVTMSHLTTGTPTVGIGTGMAFATETAIDNTETGMVIESVTTDITAGSEDFDRVTKLMRNGAAVAEKERLTSAGVYTNTGSIQLNKGADIASAAALPVLTDGNYFDVTGTTTITSINTTKVGNVIRLHFDGILTLTHEATDLILPTGADIVTATGDEAEFIEYATGDYRCVSYTRADGTPLAVNIVDDLTPQLGGDLSANGHQIQWSKGADVASATTLALIKDGNYFDVTGTTTITAFGSTAVGTVIKLHFDGILILTHNAADLVLPSGANITTAAGDEAEFIEYASGDYRCTSYTRASGAALVAGGVALGTSVATTSGTSIDFTGITSGTKRITVNFSVVTRSGSDALLVQLGDSGGVETTGYTSVGSRITTGVATTISTAGFYVRTDNANDSLDGTMILTLIDAATFLWACQCTLSSSPETKTLVTAGSKALSAVLDRVRITTTGGTNTFTAGTLNITTE